MEHAASLSPNNAEALYDLACLRLGAGKVDEALDAIEKSLTLNPKLKKQASEDPDLSGLKGNPKFESLIK
jgi:Flp pilus assembly protein TadD